MIYKEHLPYVYGFLGFIGGLGIWHMINEKQVTIPGIAAVAVHIFALLENRGKQILPLMTGFAIVMAVIFFTKISSYMNH